MPIKNVRLFLTLIAAVAGLRPAIAAPADYPKSTRHSVVIAAMRFEPQELAVKHGDTIVWINHDPFPHTVTAAGGQFDSHEIASGASWTFTVRNPGVLAYGCSLHPTMRATLRVQ